MNREKDQKKEYPTVFNTRLVSTAVAVLLLLAIIFFLRSRSQDYSYLSYLGEEKLACLGENQILNNNRTDLSQIFKECLGLKLHSVDNDNDGLSDAAEVLLYTTNPLFDNTSRQGDVDGKKVETGIHPLKPDANKEETDLYYIEVKKRMRLWKSDFVLGEERLSISRRDYERKVLAGIATFLLDLYYDKNNQYPVADNWGDALKLIEPEFGDYYLNPNINPEDPNTKEPAISDPLGEPPFVFDYQSPDGKEYVFSYRLELSRDLRTQRGLNGSLDPVIETQF